MFFEKSINFFDMFHQNRIISFIQKYNINQIIDVGAHKGEFLRYCLKINQLNKIYCFEPQKNIFKILNEKFGKIDKIYLNNFAVDKSISKKNIYISKLSSSSSLAELNDKSLFLKLKKKLIGQKENFIEKYEIETTTIDKYFENLILNNTLLKIDVEGYELNVLQGAMNKLSEIDYILVENHFFNIYKNSNNKLCHDFLSSLNFKILKSFFFPLPYFKDVLYFKEIS